MTLTYLNNRFALTSPSETKESHSALIRTIREVLLLPRPHPIKTDQSTFKWLLDMTESNPTATSNGAEFVRITGLNENFIDVIKQSNSSNHGNSNISNQ